MKPLDLRPRSLDGSLLDVGIDPSDTTVIGPDHRPKFSFRDMSEYPDYPISMKEIEHKWILPMASHIANTLNITMLDEKMYEKVLPALKSRSLFVVMNMAKARIQNNVADWYSILVMCKKHPLVMVKTRYSIANNGIGIEHIKLWESSIKKYVIHGDREMKKFMSREESTALILNYLNREGVIDV